ncbi:hypothetical protein [uncultured Duncaniella sp.]|uniref:hypothetical protein n=1 Tax=uncultured Duncaniella sp. TaxID=2768039 RepID=UPI00266F8D38|nr:hypothetical protein [uncultured Duncaniella sp.]
MKRTILYTTLGLLSLTACNSDEEALDPTGNYSVLRFEFPQGDNDFDHEIKSIYDDYGIFIIYKDITSADLNRRWTSLGTDKLQDYVPVKEADIPFYVDFLRNHVFNYLTNDLAKRAFPVKMYICEQFGDYDKIPSDLSGTGIGTGRPSTETGGGTGTGGTGTGGTGTGGTGTGGTGTGGTGTGTGNKINQILTLNNSSRLFDYWAVSFSRDGIDKKDKDEMRLARIRFIYLTIKEAYMAGTIVDTPEALSLLNFEKPYLDRDQEKQPGALDNPDHRLNRGFPYRLYESDFKETTSYEVGVAYMNLKEPITYNYFLNYIRVALYYSRDELVKKYEKHPRIIAVYDAIVSDMKNTYGIDIVGINKGPQM